MFGTFSYFLVLEDQEIFGIGKMWHVSTNYHNVYVRYLYPLTNGEKYYTMEYTASWDAFPLDEA